MRKKIVSKSGNKYLVEIQEYFDGVDHIHSHISVTLYAGKEFFWVDKTKLDYKEYYSNTEEYNDYVKATMSIIDSYEKTKKYNNTINSKKKIKEFDKWDGIIR